MLVRLLVAVCWFSSFAASSIWAAPASPKHGDVPLSQCAVVFERFSHIRLPADTKAMSRALGDSGWISRAVTYHQTILGGWIPIRHGLGPPGGVYVIALSPSVSPHNAGYRIYLHTTRAFPGDAATGIRAFVIGRSAPDIQIDEYALCSPDNHFLLVDLNSRRITPPLF